MTTSGTATFTQNRNQIINRAARLVGAIASGETPTANTTQDFSDALNAMVKSWQSSGIHLWTISEGVLFPQPNQAQYGLGGTTTDHATTTFTQTTLSAGASSGATSISVASVTGIANGYSIGVVLASGSVFWTTVNGAPSGTTVTLTSGLSGAANSAAVVLAYQTAIDRPLRIVSSRRFNYASLIDTPMNPMLSRLDYRDLPNKLATGTPTQAFYDPQLGTGQLYIWPLLTNATDAVKFTWYRQIQDFNAAANTPDFPQEWINTLTFNLAYTMAPEFGVPTAQYGMIKEQAAMSLDLAMGFDKEPESVMFQVDTYRLGM